MNIAVYGKSHLLPEGLHKNSKAQTTNSFIELDESGQQLVIGQGQAKGLINANKQGITINGNGWNMFALPQQINENTVLKFEFRSTQLGEEHGIGVSNNNVPSGLAGNRFKLYGTQNVPERVANRDFQYTGSGEFESFSIPIGQFITGDYKFIVFINDNDAATGQVNSSFRNIEFVDGNSTHPVTGTPSINYAFNFGNRRTARPEGFIKDFGRGYGVKDSLTFGWLSSFNNRPRNAFIAGADRGKIFNIDVIRNSFMQMNRLGTAPQFKWEVEVPNGIYRVIVQAGDPQPETIQGTRHLITAEGVPVIDYTPNGGFGTRTGVAEITVTDGRLTIDGSNGFNAKLNSVVVQSDDGLQFPAVIGSVPLDGATDVSLDTSISANFLSFPNVSSNGATSLDNESLENNVALFKVENGVPIPVPANINGTGGGDAINITATTSLEPNTRYVYVIEGVKDLAGATIYPYVAEFITGDGIPVDTGNSQEVVGLENVAFSNQGSVAEGRYSSLVIGPDGKLYGLGIAGQIDRWTIGTDGTLLDKQTLTGLNDAFGNSRLAIGLAFDPRSTPENLIAYVSHASFTFSGGEPWDGKLSRLTGANLENHETILTNLPRSVRDHLTNSIIFNPNNPNVLYFNQGSNSAGGDADGAWGRRPERLLSAATLKLDLSLLPATLPLDVQTTDVLEVIGNAPVNSIRMSDGTYNPYAVNSPLTIAGSGIRNAYDLVYHSNGKIYVPTNGTAGGSISPPSVEGTRRPNGDFYSGSVIPRAVGNDTQKDFLFKIDPSASIGYFGHPNPLRGEYVLNSGSLSTSKYPTGILPDVNYTGFAYDFEFNKSPNGVIEYKSPGLLQGAIIVCRYSNGDDLIVLYPNGPNDDIATSKTGITGLTGLKNPLDLIEDPNTGNIYVSEFTQDGKITLLKLEDNGLNVDPDTDIVEISSKELIFEGIINRAVPNKKVTIANRKTEAIVLDSLVISGIHASNFSTTGIALPLTIEPNSSLDIFINFNTGSTPADLSGLLTLNFANEESQTVGLYGLSKGGFAAGEEPFLQQIVNVLGYPINTGGNTLSYPITSDLLGDEIANSVFEQAEVSMPIKLTPVGRYSPIEAASFGYYLSDIPDSETELIVLTNTSANSQTLFPSFTGSTLFNISNSFGFYGSTQGNKTFYTEDQLNANLPVPHAWRIYPIVNREGNTVPNTFLFTMEEASNGDYQDYIYVVSNIKPVAIVDKNEISVSFATPVNDDVFSKGELFTVEITATSTNQNITDVQLFVDDVLVRTVTSAPYVFGGDNAPNDLTGLTVGEHVLKAIATDAVGNTEEASITISIIEDPNTAEIFLENMLKVPGTDIAFPYNDRVVFHRLKSGRFLTTDKNIIRVHNVGNADLKVDSVTISTNDFELINPVDADGFTLGVNEFRDVPVIFTKSEGTENELVEATFSVISNDMNTPVASVVLAGEFQLACCGGREPKPRDIVKLLGFATQITGNGTRLKSAYPTAASIASGDQGDLELSQLWVQADLSQPVTSFFVNGFSGNGSQTVKLIDDQKVTVDGFSFTRTVAWNQAMFPRVGDNSITDPLVFASKNVSSPFAIEIQNRSTLGSGRIDVNTGLPPDLEVRAYKIVNPDGSIRENEYFVTMDFARNCTDFGGGTCDYNDNAIYITNIKPFDPTLVAPTVAASVAKATLETFPLLDQGIRAEDILVFPNPTKDVLNLNISNYKGQSIDYHISAITGATIKKGALTGDSSNNSVISVGSLPNGLYFLNLELKDGTAIVKKFVIRK
ncbi:Ig-like domain-containing protein [Aquimarina sp. ERC-38]|uniref:T9SS type A sorting domain-containing protein n=1 Tax=Aquimarina sp. ERC-38 TaxID=2949996 RepID=UPI0022463E13|nr:T9SS type A sorting domain-containing protein [Aquimarina sp. ERC-38]UZO82368.1 Ig-like domain-containing protein [Aquimarina sp. ERC-38]